MRSARIGFSAPRGADGFVCRVDRGGWKACRSPLVLRRLTLGDHAFSVRSVRRGRRSAAAGFRWRVVEPRPFSIEPQLSRLAPLYPGLAPAELPVIVRNPNEAPILVTKLQVAVSASPPGCDGGANLELLPAGVSGARPLRIAAGGAVALPAPRVAAPAIALRDLPVNQDGCQGAQFGLTFSGRAHG